MSPGEGVCGPDLSGFLLWRELHLALGVAFVGLRQAEQSPYTVTQELQELPEICLTLHVTFTVLLAGRVCAGGMGVLVQGQSMSQRDLFKLEDAASLPPSLCEQKLLHWGEAYLYLSRKIG